MAADTNLGDAAVLLRELHRCRYENWGMQLCLGGCTAAGTNPGDAALLLRGLHRCRYESGGCSCVVKGVAWMQVRIYGLQLCYQEVAWMRYEPGGCSSVVKGVAWMQVRIYGLQLCYQEVAWMRYEPGRCSYVKGVAWMQVRIYGLQLCYQEVACMQVRTWGLQLCQGYCMDADANLGDAALLLGRLHGQVPAALGLCLEFNDVAWMDYFLRPSQVTNHVILQLCGRPGASWETEDRDLVTAPQPTIDIILSLLVYRVEPEAFSVHGTFPLHLLIHHPSVFSGSYTSAVRHIDILCSVCSSLIVGRCVFGC